MTSDRRLERQLTLLQDSDEKVGKAAEKHIIERYGARAIPGLIPLCDHQDPQVRCRVVWILGQTQDASVLNTILRMTDDLDEEVRYDAVVALGKFGNRDAIRPLIEIALETEESQPAFLALTELGAVEAMEELYRRGERGVRQMAVNSAGLIVDQTGGRRAADLLHAATADADEAVASEALWWIEQLAAKSD
jgi:HEAT repeat protein